jgi:hypothetical protein
MEGSTMSGKADRSEINELREKDLYDQKVTRFAGQGGKREGKEQTCCR